MTQERQSIVATIIFILLANSQGKLCFIEYVQLDVQIRPVFADSVTYLSRALMVLNVAKH